MRLIDADSLKARVNDEWGFVSMADVWLILEMIDEQPTAEITDCKECNE